MAKATTTIRQVMCYQPEQAAWFAANQALFNQVASFYFEVIMAHERVLELSNQEALRALEHLTHATREHPSPVMPLSEIRADIPAMFRRAAINAALGSARSFCSHLWKWRKRKQKHEAKLVTATAAPVSLLRPPARKGREKKPFSERPPVPPRSWNKSVPLYAGQWKERSSSSILLKVWTGTCWSWLKVRVLGRELPDGVEVGSPQLVRHGKAWWLHTPAEKTFKSPQKVEQQITTTTQTSPAVAVTRLCAVDLNLDEHLAVCTVQTAEGTILATQFIGEGRRVNGFRKMQLGRIARNRRKTGIIAEGEQDNVALWQKIRDVDEQIAHLVSARIVQFARANGATIIVFEHLGNLKPGKGKYSRRGNSKRAYWMKGRIFRYTKYKAWGEQIITCRVNPRNTSRECARCHSLVARYRQGQPEEGYTPGAPLIFCKQCSIRGHSDRNASLIIGQRLIARSQEKPQAPLHAERVSKDTGVARSQDAKRRRRPSTDPARHGAGNEHGTAQDGTLRMDERPSSILRQLRLFNE